MANVKISELTDLTTPDATDLVPVVDTSATPQSTKKTTVGEIVGIINGDVDVANNGTATISELPVSKLQDGDARQLLQTDAAGTGVEWTSNIDVPGTLDVTGVATFDNNIALAGAVVFEGSTANDFETTLAVTDPTADRTITLPDVSGTVVTTGDMGTVTSAMIENDTIVDADVSATAEIAVSKLANGTANQVIVTDGTNVSWSSDLTLAGNLTVNGTTTTINTETLVVEDKNIELGKVTTPTDLTADGGGITLKGTTDKTINWVDATDSWTSSERFSVPLGTEAAPSLTFTGDANTGLYSPGADQVAISTAGTGRLFVDANGNVGIGLGTSSPGSIFEISQANGGDIRLTNPTNYGTVPGTNPALRESNGISWYGNLNTGFGSVTTIGETNYIRSVLENLSTGNSSVQGRYGLAFGTKEDNESVSEAMRIDYAGRVGVGNTGPSYKLDVTGGFRVSGTATTAFSVDASSPNNSLIIDSSGRCLVGTSSSAVIGSSVAGKIQIADTNAAIASLGTYSGNANGSVLVLGKSRSGGPGSYAIVQSGDLLGSLRFAGDDGTDYVTQAANIEAYVDGTPGANDMPGRLVFSTTADGASSPTERMRIANDGKLTVPGVYDFTTADAANVRVIGGGEIVRSSSSLKYKTDVETLEDSYADAVLNCRPVWFRSLSAVDNPSWGYWGFIAEEVAEIDPRLVSWKTTETTYDENGSAVQTPCDPEPEGVQYDRFVPHLLSLIKRQQQAIETLEAKVAALETP